MPFLEEGGELLVDHKDGLNTINSIYAKIARDVVDEQQFKILTKLGMMMQGLN